MRLVVRHIYRAFPELDRFDDDGCRRFVAAACRTPFVKWGRRAIAATVWFVVLSVMLGASYWAWRYEFEWSNTPYLVRRWEVWYWLAAGVVSLVGAFLVSLVSRDLLLRWHLSIIIRRRARCAGCNYLLLGLPIDNLGFVTCPECGTSLAADPALGELVSESSGRQMFTGVDRGPVRIPGWLSVRVLQRAVVAILTLVIFTALVTGAIWLLTARRMATEAALAARESPQASDLSKILIERAGGELPNERDNAWTILHKATVAYDKLVASTNPRLLDNSTNYARIVEPGFALLSPVLGSGRTLTKPQVAAARLWAEAVVAQYPRSDLGASLRSLVTQKSAVFPLVDTRGIPLSAFIDTRVNSDELSDILAAQMELARVRGDVACFKEALEESLALARTIESSPLLRHRYWAMRAESATIQSCIRALSMNPCPELIDVIHQALRERGTSSTLDLQVDCERLILLNFVAVVYQRQSQRERGEMASAFVRMQVAANIPDTYAQAKADAEQLCGAWRNAVQQPWALRSASTRPPPWLFNLDFSDVANTRDALELSRSGAFLMISLERCRSARGRYPESLDELVPEFAATLPMDPWSSGPLKYRRLPPGADPVGRGYILYSVGPDKADDGGVESKPAPWYFDYSGANVETGADIVINRTQPDAE